MITACKGPKDFSPPTAITGIVSFVCSKTLLSFASCENAGNCANPAPISPGRVESKRGHDGAHIFGLSLFVVAIGRLGGSSNTAEVRHHDRVVLHEISGQRSPRIAVLRVPMN